MKCLTKFLLTVFIATSPLMAEEPGKQTAETFKTEIRKSAELKYLSFFPKGYSSGEKKWPLLVFLHGAGERGTNVNAVAQHGPPKLVKTNSDFPFVLVSPQCPPNQRWDKELLLKFIDSIIEEHAIDTNRVYLTGLSMGGYGTWDLVSSYPEKFAAVIPICGGGQTIDVKLASAAKKKNFASLGVWAFTGAKDKTVPVEETQRMVDAFKAVGCKDIQLTIYPEAGHDSWTETYNNPKIFEWLLAHKRTN